MHVHVAMGISIANKLLYGLEWSEDLLSDGLFKWW